MKKKEKDNDGILRCPVCGKPKELRIEFLGNPKLVTCLCDCEAKERDATRAEYEKKEQEYKIKRMRSEALYGSKVEEPRFSNAQNCEKLSMCKDYTVKWERMKKDNIGLILSGSNGCGKTFLASCIANELLDAGVRVFMTSFPQILNGGMDDRYLSERIKYSDLLIIDDYGAERGTSYAQEKIFYVIDERYRAGKPLIITTNLPIQKMKQEENPDIKRVNERILEMCLPIVFKGETNFRSYEQANKKASIIEAFK